MTKQNKKTCKFLQVFLFIKNIYYICDTQNKIKMIYGPYSFSYCLRKFRKAVELRKLLEHTKIYYAYEYVYNIRIAKEYVSNPDHCGESDRFYIMTNITILSLSRKTNLSETDFVTVKK